MRTCVSKKKNNKKNDEETTTTYHSALKLHLDDRWHLALKPCSLPATVIVQSGYTRHMWSCDTMLAGFQLHPLLMTSLSNQYQPFSLSITHTFSRSAFCFVFSGASPLCSSWTCWVGRWQQFVCCPTPFPFLCLLPSSSCRPPFASSSLLLVSLSFLVSGAAGFLGHLHRGVTPWRDGQENQTRGQSVLNATDFWIPI